MKEEKQGSDTFEGCTICLSKSFIWLEKKINQELWPIKFYTQK